MHVTLIMSHSVINFKYPVNTTVCLCVRITTCFSLNRPSSGFQYCVLKHGKI